MGYTTTKEVIVNDKRVTFTYYITSLLIVGYILGFQMLYKQAYLEKAQVRGTLEMKVKGTAVLQPPGSSIASIFDEADLVPVMLENGATFIATGMIRTLGQKMAPFPRNSRSGDECE